LEAIYGGTDYLVITGSGYETSQDCIFAIVPLGKRIGFPEENITWKRRVT
jgi:hypothetical protein